MIYSQKTKSILFGTLGLLIASYLILPVSAADSPRVYFARTGAFGIQVLVESAEPINAYDIHLQFDPSVVAIESLDTSRSLVTIVPQPFRATGGEIIIKGGSTSAFSGPAGELLTILLKPMKSGDFEFRVKKAMVYAANGQGTSLEANGENFAVRVTPDTFIAYEQSKSIIPTTGDAEPPIIIVAEVKDNPLNYGERLLVFQATDEESGVSRYEARDREWFSWSNWRQALNPYPIGESAWQIQLKAIDNNGNVSLASVYQFNNAIWKIALLILLLGTVLYGLLTLSRKKSGV
jgi:hypothetical protein